MDDTRLKILMVEDDADTRSNLRDILELERHRIDVATMERNRPSERLAGADPCSSRA